MNPNKQRGDRWECAVRDHLAAAGFDVARTRAGYARDHGDLHIGPGVTGPAVIVQAKNHARLDLAGWLDGLDQQTADSGARHGVLVVKRRMSATGRAYAVLTLDALAELLRDAGHAQPTSLPATGEDSAA